MTIPFEQIPSNLLVPGVYTEVNPNRASSSSPALPKRLVLVGPRAATGITADGVPFRIFNENDGDLHAGVTSVLGEMAKVAKRANRFVEMWGIGLTDDGSGVPATATVTVTVTTAEAGTITLYVAPYWVGSTLRGRYTIAVAAAASDATIAAAIVAAVNADPYRLVEASNVAEVVTLTAKNDGTQGNSLVCLHSYFNGEKLPTGVSLAITAFASGATNADVADAIASLGDAHTTHLVQPWTDATSLTSVETEMTRRWGGTVQRECHHFTGAYGSLGTLTTLGDGRNSELSTILGTGLSPTPSFIAAAELAALDALENHPGVPMKGRRLVSMLPPVAGSEFEGSERQQLLAEGISTYTVNSGGQCLVERVVTTYQEDAMGNADSKYRDRQVPGLLFAIRYDWRTYISTKYGNFMHAADGTLYAPDLPIVTPGTMESEFAGRARTVWAYQQGWMENPDQFDEDIVIERTEDGMDMVGAPDLINRLHIIRTRFDFLR